MKQLQPGSNELPTGSADNLIHLEKCQGTLSGMFHVWKFLGFPVDDISEHSRGVDAAFRVLSGTIFKNQPPIADLAPMVTKDVLEAVTNEKQNCIVNYQGNPDVNPEAVAEADEAAGVKSDSMMGLSMDDCATCVGIRDIKVSSSFIEQRGLTESFQFSKLVASPSKALDVFLLLSPVGNLEELSDFFTSESILSMKTTVYSAHRVRGLETKSSAEATNEEYVEGEMREFYRDWGTFMNYVPKPPRRVEMIVDDGKEKGVELQDEWRESEARNECSSESKVTNIFEGVTGRGTTLWEEETDKFDSTSERLVFFDEGGCAWSLMHHELDLEAPLTLKDGSIGSWKVVGWKQRPLDYFEGFDES